MGIPFAPGVFPGGTTASQHGRMSGTRNNRQTVRDTVVVVPLQTVDGRRHRRSTRHPHARNGALETLTVDPRVWALARMVQRAGEHPVIVNASCVLIIRDDDDRRHRA